MVTTVISIHVKVAAHFTELSAPLMLHHDLLFPSMSFQQSVEPSLASLTVMVLMNKKKKESTDGCLVASAHKQTCRKDEKRRGCL